MARIAYQKVGALLLSGVPALAFAGVGAGLVLTNGHNTLTDALVSSDFWLSVLIVGAQGLLFLYLAAYLSLSLKRLSLAIALAVMVMGNVLVTAVGSALFRFGPTARLWIFYHVCLLALAAFLHFRIGRRLKELAAAEG